MSISRRSILRAGAAAVMANLSGRTLVDGLEKRAVVPVSLFNSVNTSLWGTANNSTPLADFRVVIESMRGLAYSATVPPEPLRLYLSRAHYERSREYLRGSEKEIRVVLTDDWLSDAIDDEEFSHSGDAKQ